MPSMNLPRRVRCRAISGVLTRDHWVELELPPNAPQTGPLYLIADGFIHPWDDTITMARSQRANLAPEDLRIETPDATGEWHVAQDHLGMPAGRLKTVVLDLARIFQPGGQRRLRLRTNMEVVLGPPRVGGRPAERKHTKPICRPFTCGTAVPRLLLITQAKHTTRNLLATAMWCGQANNGAVSKATIRATEMLKNLSSPTLMIES